MLMLPDFRVRQRDFLLEISRAITAQLDVQEVLKRVLNASVVMLAGQVGFIALRAADEQFYVNAASGLNSEQVGMINDHLHELFSAEKQVNTEVLNNKLRVMAADIDEKLRQSIALPLIFAEEPLGVIVVFRTYLSGASANDLQILQSFADQAAIAVHNAQLYQKIDHERRRLGAILDHSGDGVMILDANLTIMRMNRAVERMTGWRAEDAIGRHLDEVVVWSRLESEDLQDALYNGWLETVDVHDDDDSSIYVEGDLLRADGMNLSIGISYAPLFTPDKQLANIIANVRDITNFRKAQEMQSTFISVISHELKTPVAIIKGYAATLRRSDVKWEPEVVAENLGVIEEEADRLDVLIQNLLTATKLQVEREMTLDVGEVWLEDLAALTVERVRTQTSKHTFDIRFAHDFPVVHADESRLRQVIDNLLSNAIKYTPDGGEIVLSGRYDDENITVSVTDPGVGLSADEQARVFERFYRVDGKLSRKTQGTGLGLYLSRAIVEAHGGAMYVDSQPGKGSTFSFTIPREFSHYNS
jgi:PAS domain S-box-containing protein